MPVYNVKSVTEEIAAERTRQIEQEGYNAKHDDEHADDSLVSAAIAYAYSGVGAMLQARSAWPWGDGFNPLTRRRDLIRAAALLVAEVERMDRHAR